jgi:hypothetical protein
MRALAPEVLRSTPSTKPNPLDGWNQPGAKPRPMRVRHNQSADILIKQ